MKRAELKRKKRLRSTAMPPRSAPLRPRRRVPAAVRAVKRAVVEVIEARSGGVCEMRIWVRAGDRIRWVCTGRAVDPCHLVRDGQGGPMSPTNLLHACRACHEWTHRNTGAARLKGWMRKTYDSPRSAVFYRGVWAALTDDGRALAATKVDYPGGGAPPVVVETGESLAVAA